MRKNRSKLGELQEKKLLKIEHNTPILTNICLFAAIFIQWAVRTTDGRIVMGESAVLLVSSSYLLIVCIKNGIWNGSTKKPNMKKNTLISFVISLAFAAFGGIVSYVRYHKQQGSLAVFSFMFLMMFILLMIVFTISCIAYKSCSRKLEQLADQDEQENKGGINLCTRIFDLLLPLPLGYVSLTSLIITRKQ